MFRPFTFIVITNVVDFKSTVWFLLIPSFFVPSLGHFVCVCEYVCGPVSLLAC